MSVSQFHQKFKSAVGMGASTVSETVAFDGGKKIDVGRKSECYRGVHGSGGYESVSQFTRDYRKMFGMNPKEDILKLRTQLEK